MKIQDVILELNEIQMTAGDIPVGFIDCNGDFVEVSLIKKRKHTIGDESSLGDLFVGIE